MTCQDDVTTLTPGSLAGLPEWFLEALCQSGLEGLPEAIRLLLNAAMRIERERFLGAGEHERTPSRSGYANGYKDKTVTTRLGPMTLDIPQVRDAGERSFYPSALERGLRSERALKLALAEMYVQGVSTRKVAAITEQLIGTSVSSTSVSRAAAELDANLDAWRSRPLGEFHYLMLDARYERVRIEGSVRDAAVLIAVGVDPDGRRQVLGVSVSLSEQEVHWRTFLGSLVARGLIGVRMIVSDDHAGLKAARLAIFGGVSWQRCQFHLQRNAQSHILRQAHKQEVAITIRGIFNAPNRTEAEELLRRAVERYRTREPKLAAWLEENLADGLTVFSFPVEHQRFLRTTNGLERLNQEIKRRTRVARLFPNEASCLRLVTAVVMETSDEWQTNRRYVSARRTEA
jgi:transposase-like protein